MPQASALDTRSKMVISRFLYRLPVHGEPDFEAVRETDDDPKFFCQAMGIERIPFPEILRQRMDGIAVPCAVPFYGRTHSCL